jgi:hypothetical protein
MVSKHQYSADDSAKRLMERGIDTSGYHFRVEKGKDKEGREIKVVTVDHAVTKFCLEALSRMSCGLIEKPKYLEAGKLGEKLSRAEQLPSTEGVSKASMDANEKLQNLSVIALKKELSKTDNPDEVLKKYSTAVKDKVLEDFRRFGYLDSFGSDAGTVDRFVTKRVWISNEETKEAKVERCLKKMWELGADFETRKRDPGKVADRIMKLTEIEDQKEAASKLSDSLARAVMRNIQHMPDYKVSIRDNLRAPDPRTRPQEALEHLLADHIDLRTGKKTSST